MSFPFTFSSIPLLGQGGTHYLRSSVKFNTSYSIATASPVLTTGNWSISGWVKFADIPSECVVFSQQTGGVVYRLSLFAESTYWTRLQLKIGGTTITPNAYLYYDHWIFFVVTKNGNTYNIYVDDGNEFGKANASGSSVTTPSNIPLSFGLAGGLPFFNGNIACVSFYNSVLTSTDADNLFASQRSLKKLPSQLGFTPVNEWPMEIKNGNLISDLIGGNDISVSGAQNNINVPWQESVLALNPATITPSIFWQFNGTINSAGASTYTDSISGLALTASNAANTRYVAGPITGVQGLRLSNGGSSGFLTAGASAFLDNLTDNDFTIGFYYIPLGINGAASSPRLLSKANTGTNSGYQFVRDEGSDIVSFSSGNGTTFNSFSHPKVTNGSAWDYWTIVYVKLTNTLSLYRHGTCLSTNVLAGPIAKNTNPLLIGALAGGTELETGSIAQIAVWNRALNEQEIFAAQSYNQ